ncbi:Carbohydrate kinase PfkB [Acididesulfobacillus acetoxydans]|uniref:Carbohydrate kinase PfkB n=1 Tax=Acididesulfobacillus acetoxydans TaxID=1561005 RepID=A0A8S0WEK8_9FIRM|nr:PfkB family carbohydrate kinase [Acididesulfobacillus acetoxydans]CAA7600232.1 Carbohydrate kinase PfkB [Acididesulfobacillus acetoxydans]CEJ09610.1 Carbohydrate kinase PfkB [Acididesulfobacillus acetoxydans]
MPSGQRSERYGAVAYSVSALLQLLEHSSDHAICLSHVAPEDFAAVTALLDHPNLDLTGLTQRDRGTTEIELTYLNGKERQSRQSNVMPPFTLAEMDLLAECEAVLLMPLNESDIPLACVQKLRRVTNGLLFLDVHGLITGLNERGERFRKKWADAAAWLPEIDILKMNDSETSWVAGEPLKTLEEFVEFAAGIVASGPEACWITFGDRSSLISWRAWRREKRIFWAQVPVVTDIGPVLDTTGCGDASSAGFLYSYVKLFHNPIHSVILGNTLGSLKAASLETKAFPPLPEIKGVIVTHYGEYLHTLLDDFLTSNHLIVHEFKGG